MEEQVQEPIEQKAEVVPKASPIALEEGVYQPKDGVELSAMLNVIALGGGFPERFKTKEQRIAAYNTARTLMGDQWQLALNHIAIIKGQMTIYGEFPRTLAERTGEVEEFRLYVVNKDYVEICVANKNLNDEVFAGVADVKRKGRKPNQFFYTIEDAKTGGQYPPMKWEWVNNKKTGKKILDEDSPWIKFTRVMLMRKAQAQAINFEFAESKVGVPIAEYEFDIAPDLRDVTPSEEVSPKELRDAELTEKLKNLGRSVAPSANGSGATEVQQ